MLSHPEKLKYTTVAATLALCYYTLRKRGLTSIAIQSAFSKLYATVESNQFLQAMVIPSAVGIVYYWFETYIMTQLRSSFRNWFYCSITISSKDENFKPVVDFIAKLTLTKNTLLLAETKKKKGYDRKSWRRQWNGISERKPPELDYRPARSGAMMTFDFQDSELYLWRKRGQTVTTGYNRVPLELEELTIATWAGRIDVLKAFMARALRDTFEDKSDETNIYVLSDSWCGGWENAMTKQPRSKESIVLDGQLAEQLIADATNFLNSATWYAERGIPYRRGYLLHGPPGCGKTSFTQVLAGALKLDMCMLSLSNSMLDDAKLAQNFREAPENSIILLEDVDAVFVDRDVQKKGKSGGGTGVSFSGLLNAIDGVASQEGRLFFMTTNYPEKLDSALVRPGRCDVKLALRRASRNQMKRLFLRFFPNDNADEGNRQATQFACKLPEYELSMAMLQGHLLEYRHSSIAAIEHVPALLRASKPQEVKKQTIYNHLKRVGLERLTSLFEKHGYRYQSDLHGLKVTTVQEWDVLLQFDFLQSQRLKRLLEEEKELMANDYPLASLATIRDAFFAAYPVTSMKILIHDNEATDDLSDENNDEEEEGGEDGEEGEEDQVLPPPPTLLRQTSYEKSKQTPSNSLVSGSTTMGHRSTAFMDTATQVAKQKLSSPRTKQRIERVTSIEVRLEHLAKQIAERLSVDGRGAVSLWQLRHLLSQNPYPEYAVLNAKCLTTRRPESTRVPFSMTTYQWLKRSGYARFWYHFEDAGYNYAYEMKSLKTVADVKGIGIPKKDAKIISTLITNAAKDRNLTCGMLHPDRERIRHLYRLAWPTCTHKQAHRFASLLTDATGSGKCSVRQLDQFLWKDKKEGKADEAENADKTDTFVGRCHASAALALDGCVEALVTVKKVPRPPAPPKPRPSSWIHKTLTTRFDATYANYAAKFVDAGLPEKKDVIVDPPLDTGDLDTIGVSKMGHQRAIIRWLNKIAKGEDDGVLKISDGVQCDFGSGKVVGHDKDHDRYSIQLEWGGVVHCYEENANLKRVLVEQKTGAKVGATGAAGVVKEVKPQVVEEAKDDVLVVEQLVVEEQPVVEEQVEQNKIEKTNSFAFETKQNKMQRKMNKKKKNKKKNSKEKKMDTDEKKDNKDKKDKKGNSKNNSKDNSKDKNSNKDSKDSKDSKDNKDAVDHTSHAEFPALL
jgi:chaperone BCS1